MPPLSKKDLLSRSSLTVTEVEVPELGEGATIFLQELSSWQASRYLAEVEKLSAEADKIDFLELTIKVFALSAVEKGEDGTYTRMFKEEELEEVADSIPLLAASRLGMEALKHSKLSAESKKEHFEEVEKNSLATSSDSVSA